MRAAVAVLCLLLGACATRVPPTPTVPLPPPPPPGEPTGLVGLSAAELRVAMGEPSFVRTENGSEIWRYDNPQCRAFFFLYPGNAGMAVRHVETLPPGKGTAADLSCLALFRSQPAS